MDPQTIIDAAAWVGSAGAVCGIVVQLVKSFAGVDSPRAKVATAVITGASLTGLYALSNGLFVVENAYGLAVAAVTIAAAGAGIQTAVAATATGKAQNPAP